MVEAGNPGGWSRSRRWRPAGGIEPRRVPLVEAGR